MSLRVVAICVEPPWPSHNGGRVRMAGILSSLALHHEVHVLCPRPCSAVPPGIACHVVGSAGRNRWVATISRRPKVAQAVLGAPVEYRKMVAGIEPDLLWFSHSYVAAWFGRFDRPAIVDFPNIESRRLLSLMTKRFHPARLLEVGKAMFWEPRVARRASLVCSIRASDDEVLRGWEAPKVVAVRNGSSATPAGPSPEGGPVTFVGSMDYEPNLQAAGWLVDRVWPLVLRDHPEARLRLVGREARRLSRRVPEHVEVIGDVDDVGGFYQSASLVLAPTHSGGGAQLKVTEALAHGRVVVATEFASLPFSGRDRPPGLVTVGSEDEMADAIGRLITDLGHRHSLETSMASGSIPTWEVATQALVAAVKALPVRGVRGEVRCD